MPQFSNLANGRGNGSTRRMQTATPTPPPTCKCLAKALNHIARWRMLHELSLGEPREIGEMARIGGCSYDSGAKHLRVLLKHGLVTRGRGRLFQIEKHHLPSPGQRVIDFGHCLLRLDVRP
jgi:DNA-binding transcriptional ArsR family regulator